MKIRKYVNATLVGGLAAILPLALIIVIIRWILNIIEKVLGPLVELFNTDSRFIIFSLYVLIIVGILAIFFAIGLFIQTRVGNFLRNVLEEKYLSRIPGYKTAKDIVMQFFGGNRSFFSEVVLVDIFNSGTLMTGFITDNQGEVITVFVPTGPNPTSGNIYHVKREKVFHTKASVDAGMKSIISCGSGSAELFSKLSTGQEQDRSINE